MRITTVRITTVRITAVPGFVAVTIMVNRLATGSHVTVGTRRIRDLFCGVADRRVDTVTVWIHRLRRSSFGIGDLEPRQVPLGDIVVGCEHRELAAVFEHAQQRTARTGFVDGAHHVGLRRANDDVRRVVGAGGRDRRLDAAQQLALVWRQLLLLRVVGGGCDRCTAIVPHDHEQRRAELAGRKLDARQGLVGHRVAGGADHEQFADAGIKDVFG